MEISKNNDFSFHKLIEYLHFFVVMKIFKFYYFFHAILKILKNNHDINVLIQNSTYNFYNSLVIVQFLLSIKSNRKR